MIKGRPKRARPGRLRIVAGNWRSRLLPVADVPGLRPTSERIRETLFNWIGPRIHGMHCLDLYAGTGALGFEALSRGAARVVFVDSSKMAVDALQQAKAMLDASDAAIVHADALAQIDSFPAECFDLVFLDPPFADQSHGDLCRLIAEAGLLAVLGVAL